MFTYIYKWHKVKTKEKDNVEISEFRHKKYKVSLGREEIKSLENLWQVSEKSMS